MAGHDSSVIVERRGEITVVTLNRPSARNAVNPETARKIAEAFVEFDEDAQAKVAVFTGAGGTFCAGADLKAVGAGDFPEYEVLEAPVDRRDGSAPMGPSYLRLSKPVIAAISGYAVAGGLELSLWCDMRVAEEDSVFGVFCRRWGVPLIDGGTVRLPRLIGHSNAMDLILTGRPVLAEEAKVMGLANRVVPSGKALEEAIKIAEQIAGFPQACMRNDRQSACDQWDLDFEQAMVNEARLGKSSMDSGETLTGVRRFSSGRGRGGSFSDL
jgi:enoyl-CoA hydratase